MVELVADVVMNPKFPESELERLKANMLRNLAVALSQPSRSPLQKFRAVMYGDHAYGRVFPTDAMVRYTLDQTRRFYQQTYGAGDRVSTWSDGSTNPPSRRRFEKPSPRGARAAPRRLRRPSRLPRVVHVIDRPGAPSTVIMGVPTVDPSSPDFIPMTVMDALLGGAFASRITKNIREDKGYTYSPYSELSVRYPRCVLGRERGRRR